MPRKEFLVNAIQLSPLAKDNRDQREIPEVVCAGEDDPVGISRIKKELHFEPNRPLEFALRSVFKHGGKIVLAFPDSSITKVSGWLYGPHTPGRI